MEVTPKSASTDVGITGDDSKRFPCGFCDLSFKTGTNLSRHVRVHTGERPYSCPMCPKSFSTSDKLQEHLVVHTGEKAFKCPTCSKSFGGKGNLRKHLLVHIKNEKNDNGNKDRPLRTFHCTFSESCQASFVYKS